MASPREAHKPHLQRLSANCTSGTGHGGGAKCELGFDFYGDFFSLPSKYLKKISQIGRSPSF